MIWFTGPVPIRGHFGTARHIIGRHRRCVDIRLRGRGRSLAGTRSLAFQLRAHGLAIADETLTDGDDPCRFGQTGGPEPALLGIGDLDRDEADDAVFLDLDADIALGVQRDDGRLDEMRLFLAGRNGDLGRDARRDRPIGIVDLDLGQEGAGRGLGGGADEADHAVAFLTGDELDLGHLPGPDPVQRLLRHLNGDGQRIVIDQPRDFLARGDEFAFVDRQGLDPAREGREHGQVIERDLGCRHLRLGRGQIGARLADAVAGGHAAFAQLAGIVEFALRPHQFLARLFQRRLGMVRGKMRDHPAGLDIGALLGQHLDHRARGLDPHRSIPVGLGLTLGAEIQRHRPGMGFAHQYAGRQDLGCGAVFGRGWGQENTARHPAHDQQQKQKRDPDRARGPLVGLEFQRDAARVVIGHARLDPLLTANRAACLCPRLLQNLC